MRKRIVSLMLAFCALFLLALPACASDGAASDGPWATAFPRSAAGSFTDVPAGAWYTEGIQYCAQRELMTGITNSSFSPDSSMTRAMLAVVIYRAAGSPPVTAAPDFTDAAEGVWYSDAVSWAARAGILTGYGNGSFGVDDPVTREQMVTALWRQEGSPESGQEEDFEDAAEISHWALEAVNWARGRELITGRENNRLDHAASITRGEVSMILYRYLNPGQEETPPTHETLTVSVGGRSFNVKLEDNPSALALAELTPMTITMGELNGNEKYYYLPEALPAAPERPETIQAGDLMLYGSDCLVLFYEDFSSSYSYTRLGRIEDPEGLTDALGSGDVRVSFQMPASQNGGAPFFNFETKTVTLNSGYEMPINGLGTYSLTGEVCVNSVAAALSSGVRLIDTAYMYHNEESVGEAVRSSGIPREEIFVVTKLYPSQFSNAGAAIDQALEKLDIGYIDLMLLHHPGDGDVAAYKAMEQAVADGKVRSIGLSKMEYGFNCV